MTTDNLIKDIEAVAEELITSDQHNLQELGKLLDAFQKIKDTAAKSNLVKVAEAAELSSELIKTLMLDDSIDRDESFDLLGKYVTAMQQLTRPGVDPDSIEMPSAVSDEPITQAYTLPSYLDEDIFNEFINDQDNVLEKMESHLLVLEKGPNTDTLADLRRIYHTLKGESAIFELKDIERLCHNTEDLIDANGHDIPIDKLFAVKDWFKDVFDALKNNTPMPEKNEIVNTIINPDEAGSATQSVKKDTVSDSAAPAVNESPVPSAASAESVDTAPVMREITGDIDLLSDFVSEAQEHIDNIDSKLLTLENNPEDQDILNAVFRVFHTIKGAAGFLALDDIAALAHTTENLLDMARKSELVLSGRRIDAVFEAVDLMTKMVSDIAAAILSGNNTYQREQSMGPLIEKIQSIVSGEEVALEKDDLKAEETIPLESDPLPEEKAEVVETVKQIVAEPESKKEPETPQIKTEGPAKTDKQTIQKQTKVKIKESIKVDSENLDKLVDAIGELVIIEAMIKQDPELSENVSSRLMRNLAQMEKITRELQQLGMSLRMVPVKATFQKMARIVRDLSKKEDKKIEFAVAGEDTMLDKSVVDRIGDPLIHLVRNSVDHGIEKDPEKRRASGKSPTGKIELNAFHKGGNIHIDIVDDGNGLDKDTILNKGIEKGLVREGQNLSEKEIFNMILLPGFSTAKKVTDVSGRGVGMDVVKRNITDLRGNIEISSEPGKGTTFSLRLPLTLAIIDGMLVRIGNERFIIPTLNIVKSIRPKHEDISTVINRGEMIQIRDNLIPLFRLANLFQVEGAKQDVIDGIVIVVEDSGKMAGIMVDELLGQQSTVIKSLGDSMKGLLGISGGSILSDGQVGIILDVPGLVKLATTEGAVDQQVSN